ncbi:MAG TPA: hypothetical protein PLI09_10325 [Candidatus Hydrogenedentes bacterium]|nr:hypothetical protein [Candidatus Hydrogenedentota bacterium]
MDAHHPHDCCDYGCNRREFLAAAGGAAAALSLLSVPSGAEPNEVVHTAHPTHPARVRVAFLYPPSKTFSENPDGWWSWPGNEFDAEGRQKTYTAKLREMETKHGLRLTIEDASIANEGDAKRFSEQVKTDSPEGVLLIVFSNYSPPHADLILKEMEQSGVPVILFIGLGVKHGTINKYWQPGVYFIQSLDNFEALEYGLRMIGAKKRLQQSRILSITEAEASSDSMDPFLGISVRVIPFQRYAERFKGITIDKRAQKFIRQWTKHAKELRGLTGEALENAARAHFALEALLEEEQGDGLTMNCLRRGMLKPCLSFATLNNRLVPAACENDLPAVFGQLLGQLLLGRPGFQHNPCYETERNHYYASHCTCATRLYGPEQKGRPYLLRRFAHTNEGSCAIQVFWNPGDAVTMIHYYPGEKPSLDVYEGRVVQSHPMPPAAGCTTNVEIEITDRPDACSVRGHHNLLFCGDFARQFRLFAQLYNLPLAEKDPGAGRPV